METLMNYKGNIYAYKYEGVTIQVEGVGFAFWKSALGYDLFAKDNIKLYFDSLADAKARIDREKVAA